MKRLAYSLLTIKSIDEDKRVIVGVATTPSTDRMEDIVEPKGGTFKLPIPFLHHHDPRQPTGHVTKAKVTSDGIEVQIELVKVDEPPSLKERLDVAWMELKTKLVRGLSIGFNPLAWEDIKGSFGLRFTEWEWLELSAVTIPANAEATITTLKSATQAALGRERSVYLSTPPGASGRSQPPKGPDMTKHQHMAALEAKRAASVARRDEIQNLAINDGRTKSDDEQKEYDTLQSEIKKIDRELVDLRDQVAEEAEAAKSAKPVNGETPAGSVASRIPGAVVIPKNAFITTQPNIEKGVRMARAAIALIRANGNRSEAAALVRSNQRWMDQTPDVEAYLKTAVPAGDTTTSGWASQLAYPTDLESEFVEFLRPMTVIGKLTALRRVPFNFRFGTQTASATGNWVGQGAPVPVSKPTVSSGSLGIAKASAIVPIDEELEKLSRPNAEIFVRDDMAKALSTFLDVQFLNPDVAAVANVNPASITNGVTSLVTAGSSAANLRTDLAAILTALSRNEHDLSTVVWIMAPETALNISLMLSSLGTPIYPDITPLGGKLLGLPVVTSNSANVPGSPASGRMLIAASVPQIMLADEGQVSIEMSRDAALQLLDNPTNTSTGATTATAMVSMFQTHSIAIRATRWINWGKRYSNCVEFFKETGYAA